MTTPTVVATKSPIRGGGHYWRLRRDGQLEQLCVVTSGL
jgi:hypothetical protein